jgi:hypothetical protein
MNSLGLLVSSATVPKVEDFEGLLAGLAVSPPSADRLRINEKNSLAAPLPIKSQKFFRVSNM